MSEKLIKQLYEQYESLNPHVKRVADLLSKEANIVIDHFALRTFSYSKVNLDQMALPFLESGYEIKGAYVFEEKKVKAIHLEKANSPKIFMSELELDKCSQEIQNIFQKITPQIREFKLGERPWQISYQDYLTLAKDSEYASWVAAHGFIVNHFAADALELPYYDLADLNEHLKAHNFVLNTVGGEIKGSKDVKLEQSSIMSDDVEVSFEDSTQIVPGCFYEFAYRYDNFGGFVADNADKIFHSTDRQ